MSEEERGKGNNGHGLRGEGVTEKIIQGLKGWARQRHPRSGGRTQPQRPTAAQDDQQPPTVALAVAPSGSQLLKIAAHVTQPVTTASDERQQHSAITPTMAPTAGQPGSTAHNGIAGDSPSEPKGRVPADARPAQKASRLNSAELDASQQMWNEAYDKLRGKNESSRVLVEVYEKILTQKLGSSMTNSTNRVLTVY